jgi:type VI secretion system secreted protein Hcp
MAVDMLLTITGVEGESKIKRDPTDETQEDETEEDKDESTTKSAPTYKIDVLCWSWGMSNHSSTHVGGGGGSGKVNVQDIQVTKFVDGSSPKLMLACCNGTHFDNAVLTVRKAGGTSPVNYVKIKIITEVFIPLVSIGIKGGEALLTENVSLNFAKVNLDYTPQNDKGGAGTAVCSMCSKTL